jgi:23S rRNA pseudouridine1911/1915/1917 synthase
LSLLRSSLSPPGRPAGLWPVHRLDRETSGVLLFARSREVCDAVQTSWRSARKVYLAIIDGHPRPPLGVIDQPLWEDRALNVRVGHRPDAKSSRTRFRTLERGRRRSLLQVELLTGRRHQIRAHFAWVGHPVVGDRRYGTPGPRMGLHALELSVTHPNTGQRLLFEAPPPKAFLALLDRRR